MDEQRVRMREREEARASSIGQQGKMRREKGNRAFQNGLQPETAKLFFPTRGGGGQRGSRGSRTTIMCVRLLLVAELSVRRTLRRRPAGNESPFRPADAR